MGWGVGHMAVCGDLCDLADFFASDGVGSHGHPAVGAGQGGERYRALPEHDCPTNPHSALLPCHLQ